MDRLISWLTMCLPANDHPLSVSHRRKLKLFKVSCLLMLVVLFFFFCSCLNQTTLWNETDGYLRFRLSGGSACVALNLLLFGKDGRVFQF